MIADTSTIAYWYRNGKLLEVPTLHIQSVIEDPHQFGVTEDEIYETSRRFDEPVGTEGKARDAIIRIVLKSGWIRVRFHVSQSRWVIEVDRIETRRDDIRELLRKLGESHLLSTQDRVEVFDLHSVHAHML